MRLPGTEEWTQELVSKRIAFERNVSLASPSILRAIADGDGYFAPRRLANILPSDAIFALGRAAELAFATDDFARGRAISAEILKFGRAAPLTSYQFAFFATVGALLRSFAVVLDPFGAAIISRSPQAVADEKSVQRSGQDGQSIDWPIGSSVEASNLVRLLLPAAAASDTVTVSIQGLFGTDRERRLEPAVAAVVSVSPEFESIIAWHDPELNYRQLTRAIVTLETGYFRQIELLRHDQFYWDTIRPKGSIIDWPLLALWVSMYRFHRKSPALDQIVPLSEEATFIRWLAKQFAAEG
jgi:hypothetical protein